MLNGDDSGAKKVVVQEESMKTLEALQQNLGSVLEDCEDGLCNIFTPHGQEITEPTEIRDQGQLFILVPFGRLFMWPGFHIGYKVRWRFLIEKNNVTLLMLGVRLHEGISFLAKVPFVL